MFFTGCLIGLSLVGSSVAQVIAWGQCGGQGYTGQTTCVSGYVCTYSNEYYSQCLPGTASSTSTTSTISTTTSGTGSGSTTSTTTASSVTGTATLLPNQLWIRADEDPNFHKYLQSETLNSVGNAVLGPTTSAAQFNMVSGQLVQFTPNGTDLYAQVYANNTVTPNRLQVFWSTTPATNITWSFSGDGVNGVVPIYTQQNTGAFLACNDTSSAVPNVYLNLGAYGYMTPEGCADQTLNYYNGAVAVP